MTVHQNEVRLMPNLKPEPIDVLVITHNRLELTIACISALYENTKYPWHLIVVDDSTDEITPIYFEWLQKKHQNISFVHSDKPYKSGNEIFNIGLSIAKSSYVATVMNSVTVEPEWEVAAVQMMKDIPGLGVIGFKCLFPWGQIESAGIGMAGFTPVDLGRNLAGHRLSCVYECAAVQWAFALLRKEAIPKLEEDVYNGFKGWDDIDNCFVLKKNGWKVMYCGLSVGYHIPRATRGSNDLESHKRNQENAIAFYKRWGYYEEYLKATGGNPDLRPTPFVVNVSRNGLCPCGSGKKFKKCCALKQVVGSAGSPQVRVLG